MLHLVNVPKHLQQREMWVLLQHCVTYCFDWAGAIVESVLPIKQTLKAAGSCHDDPCSEKERKRWMIGLHSSHTTPYIDVCVVKNCKRVVRQSVCGWWWWKKPLEGRHFLTSTNMAPANKFLALSHKHKHITQLLFIQAALMRRSLHFPALTHLIRQQKETFGCVNF